jgi:hypothetical protein
VVSVVGKGDMGQAPDIGSIVSPASQSISPTTPYLWPYGGHGIGRVQYPHTLPQQMLYTLATSAARYLPRNQAAANV